MFVRIASLVHCTIFIFKTQFSWFLAKYTYSDSILQVKAITVFMVASFKPSIDV